MVQMAGIEPARFIQPQDFKSCASTSSATSAFLLTGICLTTFGIILLILCFVNTNLQKFSFFCLKQNTFVFCFSLDFIFIYLVQHILLVFQITRHLLHLLILPLKVLLDHQLYFLYIQFYFH